MGVVASSLALCALAYAPFALTRLPASTPPARVIAAVVVLGVVCTALAFVLFFDLIGEIGPVRATVITYVIFFLIPAERWNTSKLDTLAAPAGTPRAMTSTEKVRP